MADALSFDMDDVLRLYDHARGAGRHWVTLEQALDLLGETEFRWPSESELRELEGRAPPALHLVMDRGVYLMSSGIPHQPDPARPGDPDARLVVYAEGFDPNEDDWYDAAHALLGGDDFAHALPLELLKPACDHPKADRLEVRPEAGGVISVWARFDGSRLRPHSAPAP